MQCRRDAMPGRALLLNDSCVIIAGRHKPRYTSACVSVSEEQSDLMGHIVTTIIPIFSLVAVGGIARNRGFLPSEFIGPANRIVYYLAIPAMIFRSISQASLTVQFNPTVLGLTLAALVLLFAVCWLCGGLFHIPPRRRGAFIQCSFHGNLGYIGLAAAF